MSLFSDSMALIKIHKYLQTPNNAQLIQLMSFSTFCNKWQKFCVIIICFENVVWTIWKLTHTIPPCACKDLIHKQDIVVGRKKCRYYNAKWYKLVFAKVLEMSWLLQLCHFQVPQSKFSFAYCCVSIYIE